MRGPSSSPRGERAGTSGARWETRLEWTGERLVDDDAEMPRANRAARRAAKRQKPVKPQQGREGACTPLSRPNSPQRTRSRPEPQTGSQSLNAAESTHRSLE